MEKKKIKGALVLSIILFFVYLLFFPWETEKELVLVPSWKVSIAPGTSFPESGIEGVPIPFRVDDHFGYVSSEGKLLFLDKVQYNVAMSDKMFINYSSVQSFQQNLISFSPGGELLQSLSLSGYPLLTGNRFFLINISGTGISEVDMSGAVLWSVERTRFITTMATGNTFVALGYSNGTVEILDKEGEICFQYSPRKSRLGIILGSAVSDDENRFAFISGINPQQLIILERKEGQFQEPRYMELDSDFRREILLRFMGEGEYLFFETREGMVSYNVQKGEKVALKCAGVPVSFTSNRDYAALVNKNDIYQLILATPKGEVLFQEAFSASGAVYNRIKDNILILGVEDHLLGLEMREL